MKKIVHEKRDLWRSARLRHHEARAQMRRARAEMRAASEELYRDLITATAVFLRESSVVTTCKRAITLDAAGMTVTEAGRLVARVNLDCGRVCLSVVNSTREQRTMVGLEFAEPVTIAATIIEALDAGALTKGDAFASLH